MLKSIFTSLLTIAFSLTLISCESPPPPAVPYKVAIINPANHFNHFITGFKQRLSDLDYHKGKIIYYYNGPMNLEQATRTLKFLKTQDINLIYTITSPMTIRAQEIFKDTGVPIVFGPVFSPIEAGISSSINRPDKNTTGIMVRGNIPKSFSFLKESMPKLKTISVPTPDNDLTAIISTKDLRKSAAKHGVKIITTRINNKKELDNYTQHLPKEADAIWLPHAPFIIKHSQEIIAAATANKIPVAAATINPYGTLLSFGPDFEQIGKQVAQLADKLLHKVPASELPIERCEYYLTVNLEVAAQTGITVPDNILQQARVITTASSHSDH